MRRGILPRGGLAIAAAIALSGAGVLGFASEASAAGTLTVTPNSGLQPAGNTTVTVAASGFTASTAGAIFECNNDSSQPTVLALGNQVPVSCSNPLNAIKTTDGSGNLSTAFTVVTGTVGPPATGTDSSGGSAATDAAKYPCPPTTAQQAAGTSCTIAYAQSATATATANISFAGACTAPAAPAGYDMAAADGGVFTFGNLPFCGSAGGLTLNKPVVGMATTAAGGGYWLAASDGGVFNYGVAAFYGSAGSLHLNEPIVGMAATHDGGGYWLVASDGGVFNYGDAGFYGSAGAIPLNKPIVGMAATHDGGGYWLVASDGGIFNYGDAGFYGSSRRPGPQQAHRGHGLGRDRRRLLARGLRRRDLQLRRRRLLRLGGLPPPQQAHRGHGREPTGLGYWLAASDGGVFNYGDAVFHGSAGSLVLNKPVVAMVAVG